MFLIGILYFTAFGFASEGKLKYSLNLFLISTTERMLICHYLIHKLECLLRSPCVPYNDTCIYSAKSFQVTATEI